MKKVLCLVFALMLSTSVLFGTAQTATQTLTINVVAQLTVTTVTAPPAVVGTPYSFQLAASGGVSPYTWTLQAGSVLPAGLTLSSAGLISGTPTASGPVTFTVVCKDSE